jgi:mannose-6-phosphate isomerase-like protein (cupin superfamily)
MFSIDIEKATKENTDYRRVIYTVPNLQLVLMQIPIGEDIELEIHPNVDQFFRIESGKGEFHIGKEKKKVVEVKDGSAVVIKHGTYHRVLNTSSTEPLKLYTIYTPANHPFDRVDKVRPPPEKKTNFSALLYLLF